MEVIEKKSKIKLEKYLTIELLLLVSFFVLSCLYVVYKNNSDVPKIIYGSLRVSRWIETILILTIDLIIVVFLVVTLNEYKRRIIRKTRPNFGNRYLTINDVFDNEHRKEILKEILEEPGIHNNELLRRCKMQNGQLQWHLDVLLQYKAIKQVKTGQYTTYYPVIKVFNGAKMERGFLIKSKTALKILDIIEQNPGINSSAISRQLKLARSTLKYHVDKLLKMDLILIQQQGNKIQLFSNQQAI